MADRDRERGDGAVVVYQAVETSPLGARLLHCVADDDQRTGQDLEMVRVAAGLLGPALDIGVEALGACKVGARGEDHLCRFGSELAAGSGHQPVQSRQPWTGLAILSGPHRRICLLAEHVQPVGVEVDAA